MLLGEADAGLVYVTDVRAAGEEVEGIEVPEADAAVNLYPAARIADRTAIRSSLRRGSRCSPDPLVRRP